MTSKLAVTCSLYNAPGSITHKQILLFLDCTGAQSLFAVLIINVHLVGLHQCRVKSVLPTLHRSWWRRKVPRTAAGKAGFQLNLITFFLVLCFNLFPWKIFRAVQTLNIKREGVECTEYCIKISSVWTISLEKFPAAKIWIVWLNLLLMLSHHIDQAITT